MRMSALKQSRGHLLESFNRYERLDLVNFASGGMDVIAFYPFETEQSRIKKQVIFPNPFAARNLSGGPIKAIISSAVLPRSGLLT